MGKLVVAATSETPEVILDSDKGFMSIKGRSFSEKTADFFEPIFNWTTDYFESPQPNTVIELELEFLNSASNKLINDLLKKIKASAVSKSNITVKWKYQKDDEDVLFYGNDLEEYSGLTFEYVILD